MLSEEELDIIVNSKTLNVGERMKDLGRKTITVIAVVLLLISGNYLGKVQWASFLAAQNTNKLAKLYTASEETGDSGILKAFLALLEINPDTKAWIVIENANVNNVVVQKPGEVATSPTDYHYLHSDFNNNPSKSGTLFFGPDNVIERDQTSQNLTIHGHSMRNGQMFGTLKEFRDLDFYKENPLIRMDTLYERGVYEIFSVIITNADPTDDNGQFFDYTVPDFETQEEFIDFVSELKKRSMHDIPVDVEEGDQILTLSTCEYDFTSARLVIVARKVKEGESEDVQTVDAVNNPNTLFPQAWYDRYGGTKPSFDEG